MAPGVCVQFSKTILLFPNIVVVHSSQIIIHYMDLSYGITGRVKWNLDLWLVHTQHTQ